MACPPPLSAPCLTIRSLPLELHLEILRHATTHDLPIHVTAKSLNSPELALPGSISPLYTTPSSLSLLPRYFSTNSFLLLDSNCLEFLKRSAGPHVDRIEHIAFDLTQFNTWYSLISGQLKGLRKITLFDQSERKFSEIYQENPEQWLGAFFRADDKRALKVSHDKREPNQLIAEGTATIDRLRGDYHLNSTAKIKVSDVEVQRLIQVLVAVRPEIEEVSFAERDANGDVREVDGLDAEELTQVLRPLREADAMPHHGSGGFEDEEVKVCDWELLWEQATMDDMKAWARGADDAMRRRLRMESWTVRMACLRAVRGSDKGREEIRESWSLRKFEAWCAGFRSG